MAPLSGFEHIVREREPLAPHTWLRLGGVAEYFAEPTSVDELSRLVRRCAELNWPVRLLGGGSNLLIRDEGVAGVVVRLAAGPFCAIEVRDNMVTCGGGARLGHVISASVGGGLGGLEQLAGIPGTVGGALHGNAGTEAGDIGQFTESATVMLRSGEILTRAREDLRFAYRASSLDELVILSARFQLERDNPEVLTKRLQKRWIIAKSSQPTSDLTAGCIFKNPIGATAANLIEQAGLKGARSGQVEVSGTHPNFFVAGAGATSRDVLKLIDQVKTQVATRLGVELETQIEVW
ncbi:MAG: UDP-N-acetylmuramate dehydrogenase [Pirellulales bacterium]